MAESMQDPKLPSREEGEEHSTRHLPYRNLCRHCVRGRGREAPHTRGKEDPSIPEVHIDFMFLGEEGSTEKLTVLVVKERVSKMLLAAVVPSKSVGEFAARRTVAFMREMVRPSSDHHEI